MYQHQGDHTTSSNYYYPQTIPTPNPNPTDPHQSPYVSAPPFSVHSPNYPSFSQNPDPTAPSYAPTPSPQPLIPTYESHAPNYYSSFDDPNYPPNSYSPRYTPELTLSGTTAHVPPNPYENFYDQTTGSYGDGVYAYEGGKAEPYGARGTAPKSSTSTMFDDYGRSISVPEKSWSSSSGGSGLSSAKIVRAVPKVENQQDVKSGVQKFRVKLLPESGGQTAMDVLCQIGLDGIRMLDPNTSRTLRIYPLENITRYDVTDSSTLAFWSKSSVDIEPRRIRLQSSSYTTNTLLDIMTAATVQFKEMGGLTKPSDFSKTTEQPTEKKRGLADWMNIIRPGNEEKDHWVPDEAVTKCTSCGTDFGPFVRKHHCRNCGEIFCDKCTHGRIALSADENAQPVRVCDRCLAEVTQRLSNAKEAASKPVGLHSHEDLARKLQEEMERNRKVSSGSKSDGSGRMREVACPICTVHLQVQVPSSGSETIECGVCQHPFLVSAH